MNFFHCQMKSCRLVGVFFSSSLLIVNFTSSYRFLLFLFGFVNWMKQNVQLGNGAVCNLCGRFSGLWVLVCFWVFFVGPKFWNWTGSVILMRTGWGKFTVMPEKKLQSTAHFNLFEQIFDRLSEPKDSEKKISYRYVINVRSMSSTSRNIDKRKFGGFKIDSAFFFR